MKISEYLLNWRTFLSENKKPPVRYRIEQAA